MAADLRPSASAAVNRIQRCVGLCFVRQRGSPGAALRLLPWKARKRPTSAFVIRAPSGRTIATATIGRLHIRRPARVLVIAAAMAKSALLRTGSKDCVIDRAPVDRVVFPPEQVAAVNAVACELAIRFGLPLSRFSRIELHRLVIELAVTGASASTIWRWLHDDALKPWQTRSRIYQPA